MPEQQQQERELKAAFIQHLPERITSIGTDWTELSQGPWSNNLLIKLCQKIQHLTGISGRFGLINLSESSFSLEVYLGELTNSDTPPTNEQQQTVGTLITALKHEAELLRSKAGIEKPANHLIYLLLSNDKLAPGLSGILEGQECTVLPFNHPDDLEAELQRRLPHVLLIDDSFLVRMALLNRELAIQQERQKQQVAVICISQSRDLEQRLLALRCGVDAYYPTPINIQDVTDRVIDLASPKTDRYRILIVEDDQSQADFAASILKKSGMKTRVITDPMKIIEELDTFRPDLILMDLYMPNANGVELTAIIREHPDFLMTPIVFLSGEQDTDKQLHALSVGGDDFLSKPIRPRHLINTITNRVQRARILEKHHHPPSSRDLLTGLYTRRHFYEQLDRITTRMQDQPTTGGVLYISLRPETDASPNHETDAHLANIGSLIGGLLEEQDIAARIDEKDFALLALRPHQKNILNLAEKIAQELLNAKARTTFIPAIGIAMLGGEFASASELIANAAAAVQEIQDTNQHVGLYAEPGNGVTPPTSDQLPELFKQALKKQSFQLLFKPLVQPQDPTSKAISIKPRLALPKSGQLGSSDIMRVADEATLGSEYSRWLVERALTILEEKRAEGKSNLLIVMQSAESIFEGEITSWLRDQLRARQMVGVGLVLEYRIAKLSTDLKIAREHFLQLQEMGVKVLLSRFGASSTALKVLHYLHADFVQLAGPILKADESQIADILAQIRNSGAGIILPADTEPKTISPAWLRAADWVPVPPATPHR